MCCLISFTVSSLYMIFLFSARWKRNFLVGNPAASSYLWSSFYCSICLLKMMLPQQPVFLSVSLFHPYCTDDHCTNRISSQWSCLMPAPYLALFHNQRHFSQIQNLPAGLIVLLTDGFITVCWPAFPQVLFPASGCRSWSQSVTAGWDIPWSVTHSHQTVRVHRSVNIFRMISPHGL